LMLALTTSCCRVCCCGPFSVRCSSIRPC
jgi:hypothetical protein